MAKSDDQFITVFEDGSLHFICGEVPQEILKAADDGLYDVICITDPKEPMRYWDGVWVDLDRYPVE